MESPEHVISALRTLWPHSLVSWSESKPIHASSSPPGFIDVRFADGRRLEVERRTPPDSALQRQWLVWALDAQGELLAYSYSRPFFYVSPSQDHAEAIAERARWCFANAALDEIRVAASEDRRDPQGVMDGLRSLFAGIPEEADDPRRADGFSSLLATARSLLPLGLNVDPIATTTLQEEFAAFVADARTAGFEVPAKEAPTPAL